MKKTLLFIAIMLLCSFNAQQKGTIDFKAKAKAYALLSIKKESSLLDFKIDSISVSNATKKDVALELFLYNSGMFKKISETAFTNISNAKDINDYEIIRDIELGNLKDSDYKDRAMVMLTKATDADDKTFFLKMAKVYFFLKTKEEEGNYEITLFYTKAGLKIKDPYLYFLEKQ